MARPEVVAVPPIDPPPDCPGLDDCGPAQPLRDRIDRLEASVRVVAAGHVSLTQQMTEVSLSLSRADERINVLANAMQKHADATMAALTAADRRVDALSKGLEENSKATLATLQAANEIKDLVTTGKTMGKLAKWLAPTLVAAAVAVGVLKGWAVDVGQAIKAASQK